MPYTVLIPARLASARLPNKPLADIAGLPMVVRVAQRVQPLVAAGAARQVVVATDSQHIMAACQAHGVDAILTDLAHPSGSDRLAQASSLLGLSDDEIVLNVQGDEPLIECSLVDAVAQLLQNRPQAQISTAAHNIEDAADFHNPNVVKVVLDKNQMALYFSRAPIPCTRDADATAAPALRHVGIYGYRAGVLRQLPKLAPAPIEHSEALEQLRALWHGWRIAVHVSLQAAGIGVDTEQDLARVREIFRLSNPT